MPEELTPCERLRLGLPPLPGEPAELYLSDGVSLNNKNLLLTEGDEWLVWEGVYG